MAVNPTDWEADRNAKLVDFEDASRLDHRRLLLAPSKALGAFAVDIDTRELFSILIIDGNLPVPMLAAAVTA